MIVKNVTVDENHSYIFRLVYSSIWKTVTYNAQQGFHTDDGWFKYGPDIIADIKQLPFTFEGEE